MATNSTLLCIHRDPAQLSLLQEHGYELLIATNGHEGLRLFMSQPVDAIVLDYQLGLLDGGVVAAAIKNVKPQVPIVMLAGGEDLPDDALRAVDALVAKADGPISLLETVHSVLKGNATLRQEGVPRTGPPVNPRHLRRSWDGVERRRAILAQLAIDGKDVAFSRKVWRSIRDGTVRF
ncbi:MAG: response regulator [Terriglobales bacterium]|jgi:DNA-binding response OmpR family regulator